MKKFKGFTLTELMVAVAVLGILSAIVLPMLLRNNPSQNKMMMKKAYYTTSNIVSEMINDPRMYPTYSGEYEYSGFDNTSWVPVEGDYFGGALKFGRLFATFLNVDGDINTGSASGAALPAPCPNAPATLNYVTFNTQDGIAWCIVNSDNATSYGIYADVNGNRAPNCYQGTNGGCADRTKNFDRFSMAVQNNGKINIDNTQTWAKDAVTVNSDMNGD